MTRGSRICAVFFAFSVCLSTAYGETIAYKKIMKETAENSARIRAKEADVGISEANYEQAAANLYPELSIAGRLEKFESLKKQSGFDTISGQVVGGERDEWRTTTYLSAEYYLSNLYKRTHEAAYYEKLKEANVYECNTEMKRLAREVTDIYSALSEGKIKLRYSEEMLSKLNSAFKLRTKAYESGELSYEDLLKAEAEIVNVEKDQTALRREIKDGLAKLSSYSGKEYGEASVVDPLPFRGFVSDEKALKKISNMPEYLVRHKELEALREKYKAVAGNFWPDISVYSRYDFYGSSNANMDSSISNTRKTAFSAGVFAVMPLFDAGRKKWERAKALREIRKQEETVKAVVEEKGRDAATLYIAYSELSKTMKHYAKLADRYDRMLGIAKKAQELGERSAVEIIEIEKDSLSIRRDMEVTANSTAAVENKLMLETDYKNFIGEIYGNGTCKY